METFSDLVMLVGSNPLPNYVVGKYFLAHQMVTQRIWLLYSEKTDFHPGTKQYAESINRVLGKEFKQISGHEQMKFKLESLEDISHAPQIEAGVTKIFEKLKKGAKVHLNYTGGTKAMAVHIYRILAEKYGVTFSASYLDAREFRIRFDDNLENKTDDLRKEINISWESLFDLHNCEKKSSGEPYFDPLPDDQKKSLMNRIAELAEGKKLMDLRDWYKSANQNNSQKQDDVDHYGSLFDSPKNENCPKTEDDLKFVINKRLEKFKKTKTPELINYLCSFPDADKFCDEEGNWAYNKFNISGKSNNSKNLKGFMDGKWLESYVAWVIQNKIQGKNKPAIITNLKIETVGAFSEFELDVAVLNGYQICGISCGTALDFNKEKKDKQETPPSIKNKGFEVILRSSQIGGEEARSALVTLLNETNAAKLQNNLQATFGLNKSQFIVLGVDDLPGGKLWKKLETLIY